MQNDSEVISGQRLIVHILGAVVEQACGCNLIYANESQPTDDYPYMTFNFITPEQETTSDWLGDDRQYYTNIQLDAHSDSFYEAMDLATKLHEALESETFRRFFTQCNIVPTQITNSGNRTILASINYDQDFGFDCSFLVNGNQKYDTAKLNLTAQPEFDIKTAKATNTLTGSTVDTRKNFKEEK